MALIERINGSFLAKLSGSSSETAASAGAGGINFTYDSVNLSDGLSRLQQAFQDSSERLVSPLAAFEGVRQVLEKLVDLTGDLEKIAERAARDGIADAERRGLNSEFQKIVSDIRFILAESEQAGGLNFRDKTELEAILENSGLDTTAATELAKFFASVAEGDGELGYSRFTLTDELFQLPTVTRVIGDGTFQAVQSSTATGTPRDGTAGDVNGDSIPDIITSNYYNTFSSLLLGVGDGTYSAATTIGIGASQRQSELTDVNGDGIDDLIVTTSTPQGVTYEPEYVDILSNVVLKFEVGDFNSDGIEDVVSVHDDVLRITLFGADGESTTTTSTLPETLKDYDVGDFNNDGFADILYTRSSSGVGLYMGNGDGTFSQGTSGIATADGASFVDLNNDGNLDIVAVDNTTGTVTVFPGTGDGSYSTSVSSTFTPPYLTTDLPQFGDLDGDGDLDLVNRVNDGANGLIYWSSNQEDGTFQAMGRIVNDSLPEMRDMVIFDREGDGDLDIASVDDSGTVYLYENDGTGTFTHTTSSTTSGGSKIAASDLTGDGISELIVYGGSKFFVLEDSDGLGNYTELFQSDAGSLALTVFDRYNDGTRSFVIQNSGNEVYYLNTAAPLYTFTTVHIGNGDGTFAVGQAIDASDTREFTLFDANGDQILDLVTADGNYGGYSTYLGNGDGTFQAPITAQIIGFGDALTAITSGSFDGSSTPGLVTVDSFGVVRVSLANGNGTFRAPTTIGTGALSRAIAVGDIDGNGFDDIAFISGTTDRAVYVVQANGDGTFRAPVSYAADAMPIRIAMADLDGDGRSDIVTSDSIGESISVYVANSDGTFLAATSYAANSTGEVVRLTDLNGDGVADILTSDGNNSSLSVLLGNSETSEVVAVSSARSSSTDPLLQDIRTLGGAKLALQAVRKLKKDIEKDLAGVEGVLGEVNAARRFALAGFLEAERLNGAAVGGLAEAQSVAESLARAIRTRLRDGQLSEHSALDTELVKELLAP